MANAPEYSSLLLRRQLGVAAQTNASRNDRIEAQQSKVISIYGVIAVDKPGEATVDITFPVTFIERPCFNAGLEMQNNESVVLGNYPVYGVTVNRWTYKQATENIRYWVGCNLAIRIQAPKGRFFVHYEFLGQALRSPGSNLQALNDAL